MKSVSKGMHEGVKEEREPTFDWEQAKFGLAIIALLGFVYGVHLLIHMW